MINQGGTLFKLLPYSIMKKVILICLLLVLFTVAGFFAWLYIRYAGDPDPNKSFLLPKVAMSVIEVNSLSAEKADLSVGVLIKNQLPITIKADSFQYQLYINDAEIIKTRYKKTILLEANDSSWITLPVTVLKHDVDSVIKANEKRGIDSVEYKLNATFVTDLIFKKKFSVSVKRFLPLIHIPDLKVNRVEIDSLNFKRAAVTLDVDIRNDNVFDIKVKDYSYEAQIEDHEWIKGTIKGITDIKAKATTGIEIPMTISLKEVGKTIGKLLRKGKNVNYKLTLKFQMESDVDMLKHSKAIVKSSGSVKSLLKAVKPQS